jgi:uncharacterized protein
VKKSIYISRKVLNTNEIRDWARLQGFASCVPTGDMHITVAFDKKKHDWRELPLQSPETITVLDPNERRVEEFRGGAIVLEVYSTELTTRWAELTQAGLYWKWPDYRPHVTITYNKPAILDVSKIMPFDGKIELGPEIAVEVVDTWKRSLEEDILLLNQ